jgi:hypothetical protein
LLKLIFWVACQLVRVGIVRLNIHRMWPFVTRCW